MKIRLTALAEFDLLDAKYFYASRGDDVLQHFDENITVSIDKLADIAGVHPKRHGLFCAAVSHFPYSIYYDIEGDVVVVHAILDNRFGPQRLSAHFAS